MGVMGLSSADRRRRLLSRRSIRRRESGRVLFVTAATGPWKGEGSQLYQHEPTFKGSIDAAARVAEPLGVGGISEAFASAVAGDPREAWVCTGVLHAALIDLWRGIGVIPDGVLGVGVGELSAAYAAGMLSRAEFVSALCELIDGETDAGATSVVWSVEADTRRSRQLCAQGPAPLRHRGTYGPGLALLSCDEPDAPLNTAFLEHEVRVIECSRRAPAPRWRQQAAAHGLSDRASRPNCPIYSAAVGRRLTSGSDLGALCWTSSPERSFYFDEALADAVRDGFEVMITIGDEPPRAQAGAGGNGATPTMIRTLDPGGEESRAWHRASGHARGLSRREHRPRPVGPHASITPATFDFRDPRVVQDPYPYFEELSRLGPIHWLPRHRAWLVLRHADVSQVLLSASCEVPGMTNTGIDRLRHEDVAELRRLMRTWLSVALVERVMVETKSVADELIRRRRGGLDVVGDLAQPLSEHVAGRLLGLDPAAIESLSDALDLGEQEPTVGLFVEASAALTGMPVRTPISEELKRTPLLTETQADSFIREFWVAAALTSRFAIPSAVALLLEQPALQAQLRTEPELIPAFVAEALRLHPPHHTIERITTSEMVLAGTTVPAGSELCACVAAANRDPAHFEDPTSVRLQRPARHLTFGFGPHRCPGARVGQNTVAAAVAALLELDPPIREAQPVSTLRWVNIERAHALEHLWIGWD
jgi:cytochrome P450